MTDTPYTKKTATPAGVSSDELKDLQKAAKQKEADDHLSEVMSRGHEMVQILCDDDEYESIEDIQALAAQAVYNLKRKYEQFTMSELDDVNEGDGNPRHLMRGMRLATKLGVAFDIITESLQ